MSSKHQKRAVDMVLEYKPIPLPHKVMCFLGAKALDVYGNQITLDDDCVSLEQAREAAEWLANQLGGKVIWDREEEAK